MPLRETFVISSEPQHYFVNGVKYIVHSHFQDMGENNATLKSRFCRILENISLAHLTDDDISDTMTAEYVSGTAGEEEYADQHKKE